MATSSSVLVNYYRLCKIIPYRKHALNSLPEKQISVLFDKKEMTNYLRETTAGEYKVNEFVIGGRQEPMKVLVFGA